jgi:hypothetical protein
MTKTTFNQLTEIHGIDATDIGLLVAAGIHSLHDLAHARAEDLTALLDHLGTTHGLDQEGATIRQVETWIRKARELDPLTVAHDELQKRLGDVGTVLTLEEWEEYLHDFLPPR